MKFRKELIHVPGSFAINYRTGRQTIGGEEVGIRLKMSGKCEACRKPRSRTFKFHGYINNGFNRETFAEAKARYTQEAGDYIAKLETGEYTEKCDCGGIIR